MMTGSEQALGSRALADLIAIAKAGIRENAHEAWDAIQIIRGRIDSGTFATASALCRSADPLDRRVGAGILGQFGRSRYDQPGEHFYAERLDALITLLRREVEDQSEPDQLGSAISALGHLRSTQSVPDLLPLRFHPSKEVRFSTTLALTSLNDDDAINALIELTDDMYEDVRDWATFGLGSQIDRDTPAIRDALRRRLDDPHGDTRAEAILGLARRKDRSVVQLLIEAFESDAFGTLMLEAAVELADPRLHPALAKAGERRDEWEHHEREWWQDAEAACRPSLE